MEVKGKVIQLLPLQSGMGKKGLGKNRNLLSKHKVSIRKKYAYQYGVIR